MSKEQKDKLVKMLEAVLGCVNKHPIGPFPAESLFIRQGQITETGLTLELVYVEDHPNFNKVPWRDDGKDYRITNKEGKPLFEPI